MGRAATVILRKLVVVGERCAAEVPPCVTGIGGIHGLFHRDVRTYICTIELDGPIRLLSDEKPLSRSDTHVSCVRGMMPKFISGAIRSIGGALTKVAPCGKSAVGVDSNLETAGAHSRIGSAFT